jgi:hypothetical protein
MVPKILFLLVLLLVLPLEMELRVGMARLLAYQ